jgi:hypothetical protein
VVVVRRRIVLSSGLDIANEDLICEALDFCAYGDELRWFCGSFARKVGVVAM